jgi:RNA polymerase sigma factor (TIGR02999 family)
MLQPTALVHEAYLRLAGQEGANLANRRVFFAAAAKTMRRILVDDARTRKRQKRGGGARPAALHELDHAALHAGADGDGPDGADLLALDEALQRLEQIDPRMAEVIELRFHGGLSRDEIAETLDLAPRTVDKLWHFGRAWLHRQMSPR